MKIIKKSLLDNSDAFLKGYLRAADLETKQYKYPAVIVVPGGSFTHIPIHQSESLALNYTNQGFQSFYLRYSFEQEKNPLMPNPIFELGTAIKMIKENADEWNIDTNRIIIAGFSIGGYIVSLFNNYYDSEWLTNELNTDKETLRPKGTILGYPVINLRLGFPKDPKKIDQWASDEKLIGAEQHVTSTNVPTFIWGTADDPFVPTINSLKYAEALSQQSIPFESHTFHHGPHGMALANHITAKDADHNNPHVAQWNQLANEWLKDIFKS